MNQVLTSGTNVLAPLRIHRKYENLYQNNMGPSQKKSSELPRILLRFRSRQASINF
ncbi:hypothetical protein BDR06DRAFT_957845, partial [Suillus hirtellus]